MLRIALIDIFMFSLPFLIYGAYMIAAKGTAARFKKHERGVFVAGKGA